jgi:hypothetical protein
MQDEILFHADKHIYILLLLQEFMNAVFVAAYESVYGNNMSS